VCIFKAPPVFLSGEGGLLLILGQAEKMLFSLIMVVEVVAQ
jgi:hypothetical protein